MTAQVENRRGFRFWIGVFMIAVSFGIYPAYPTIALLPISANAKVASGVAGSVLSWTLFFIGTTCAGKAGRELVLGLFARMRRRKRLEGSAAPR